MLLLNPAAPERFLEQEGGNQCEQVARKYLRKLMEDYSGRLKGMQVKWHHRNVSHHVKGTLGYVEWFDDDTILVSVPYPKTPYQLEVFLHELAHVWLDHDPRKSCNGKKNHCRPENREEYEAEKFAMDILRKEGIEVNAEILEDAQDNVVNSLFRDSEDGLPVSRAAIQFVQINDRLQDHRGWENFLEDVKSANVINPATRGQYRLAQAVLRGTATSPTRMTKAAARKLVDDTPVRLRRAYMRNPAEQSAEVYEEFHGAPSEYVTQFEEKEHYHSHLAELGVLRGLKFRTVDGEGDVTLDFEGDEDEKQSGNLFGFGRAQKTGSSRLMRGAYQAGYRGEHGVRGHPEFREWLDRAARNEDLHGGFVKQLQAEYFRGVKVHESELKVQRELREDRDREREERREAREQEREERQKEREAKQAAASRAGKSFLGYEIMPARGGGFVVPDLGRGRFKTVAEAKKAISTRNPRKGPLASASEFVGSMAHGAARGVDSLFTGNPADDDGPVILCSNESMNQLYLVGGDQSINLGELKINGRHDSVVLGQCWAICYSTEKEFDDFERIEYVHTFAPDKLQRRMSKNADLWEQAKPPYQEAFENGDLPTLRYDVLNQTLHFDGGSYFVTDKGIED